MVQAYDGSKLRKVIKIYWVVQGVLAFMLVFMAVNFQGLLQAEGRPERFLHSVVAAIVLQLLVLYPLKRFADGEVERDIASSASGLTTEELKKLRQKRIFSDYLKASIIVFFFTFVWLAPKDRFILSTIFLSFILTMLTYFQCYNFVARRALKEKGV